MPWDRAVSQAGRPRASPPTPSTSSSRPATRDRSRRSASTCRTIRPSASSTAASRSRSRTSTRPTTSRPPRSSAREFSWTPEEAARAEKWSSARRRAAHQHARGHRPRLRASSRIGSRATRRRRSRSSTRRSRRAAPISSRSTSCPIRSSRSWGWSPRPISEDIVLAEYEGYTRNALVQLRRVREGTQIEEDHMRNRQMIVRWLMANTKAIDVARARRQDLLRDDRSQGVPRRRRPAAGRGPAHQVGRGLRGGPKLFETYGIHFDPKLRDEIVGRVEQLKLPSYTGLRAAPAHAGDGRRRQDHRREDLVPDGPDDADARLLRTEEVGDAQAGCGSAVSSRSSSRSLACMAGCGPQAPRSRRRLPRQA